MRLMWLIAGILVAPAGSVCAQPLPPHSQQPIPSAQLVREVVYNELHDHDRHGYWRYWIERRTPKFGDRSQSGPANRQINARRSAKLGRLPLSRLLDHFDHAIKTAGVDHVGLGSDFDGAGDLFPEGMEDISKMPNLVRGLMERGYSDTDILKILGGNTLRVMREVETAARRLQK